MSEKSCNNCKYSKESNTDRLSACFSCSEGSISSNINKWEAAEVEESPKAIEIKVTLVDSKNNGGTTGYYDVPLPDRTLVDALIVDFIDCKVSREETVTRIFNLFPKTLNDLIEYKDMKPWQHEVMKACYAIDDRKNKGNAGYLREVNKILYFTGRAKDMCLRGILK